MNPYRMELEIFQRKGGELRRENGRIVIPDTLERDGICTWVPLSGPCETKKSVIPDNPKVFEM